MTRSIEMFVSFMKKVDHAHYTGKRFNIPSFGDMVYWLNEPGFIVTVGIGGYALKLWDGAEVTVSSFDITFDDQANHWIATDAK